MRKIIKDYLCYYRIILLKPQGKKQLSKQVEIFKTLRVAVMVGLFYLFLSPITMAKMELPSHHLGTEREIPFETHLCSSFSQFRSLAHVDSHSSLVGYCPQEDALDDLLTVEEHLYFYARIHGIPEKDIKEVSISVAN